MRRKLALALVASSALLVTSFDGAVSQEAAIPSATEALHVLPPLGRPVWHVENDRSLLAFLRVTVCRVEGEACPVVREYTAESGKCHDGIALRHGAYQVSWHLWHDHVGRTFRVSFDVAGLGLGRVEATARAPWTVPVRFLVEPNPRVRARAMHAAGASSDEIAAELLAEFELAPVQVATVLAEESFDVVEIAEALRSVFGLDAAGVAQTLAEVGFGAVPIATALRDVFGLDAPAAAQVLKEIGFPAAGVGAALRDVYALDGTAAAEVLRGVGFPAEDVAGALLEAFGLDASAAAEALRAAGFGAAEIGGALVAVYGLDAAGVATALRDAGYSAAEVAAVLKDVLGLGPEAAAQALAAAGYGAEDVYEALRSVFGLDEEAAWAIVEGLGYDEEEIFQLRAGILAVRFAPQLRFDSGSGTCPAADSYPMSAQEYFERRTQGETGRLSNGDAATVTGNLVPTYWKAFRCGNQYRLVYWWFYGYQYECDCVSGEHEGDWEHVMVVLSEDKTQIAAVTFFQHAGFYTRLGQRGGYGLVGGTHPVVYPGRNAHGSYHNTQSGAQTCCYWEDHRDGDGPWLDTWVAPLERMRPVAQGGEPWMDADLAGTFSWGVGTHPTQSTSGNCGQQTCAGTPTWGCHESGCFRSQCEVGDRDDGITCWHCPPGYTDWGFACTRCDCGCSTVSIETYGLRYTISMTDAGLMYKAP